LRRRNSGWFSRVSQSPGCKNKSKVYTDTQKLGKSKELEYVFNLGSNCIKIIYEKIGVLK